jgi:ABC-type multidrug transport system fused ATPase/permease subunit
MKNTLNIIFTIIAFILDIPAIAQRQQNIPKPSDPLDLSDTSTLVIFILIPLVILISYFIFRKRIQRRRQERFEKRKEEKDKS